MQAMTDFLNNQPAWHWWALGAILLALEIASTTQYLLWPGIAALLVGVLKFVVPSLDGRFAVFLFAVIAVGATILWKRSRLGRADRTTHLTLNERSTQYMGRRVGALEDFQGTRGAVRVDDSRWNAMTLDGTSPKTGDALEVTGSDGHDADGEGGVDPAMNDNTQPPSRRLGPWGWFALAVMAGLLIAAIIYAVQAWDSFDTTISTAGWIFMGMGIVFTTRSLVAG